MRCYKVTTGRTSGATNWKTQLKCVHFWKKPALEDMAWALLLGDLICNLKSCHIESMRTRQFKRKFYRTWKKKIIAGSLLHVRGSVGRGDTYRKYVNVSNRVKSWHWHPWRHRTGDHIEQRWRPEVLPVLSRCLSTSPSPEGNRIFTLHTIEACRWRQ